MNKEEDIDKEIEKLKTKKAKLRKPYMELARFYIKEYFKNTKNSYYLGSHYAKVGKVTDTTFEVIDVWYSDQPDDSGNDLIEKVVAFIPKNATKEKIITLIEEKKKEEAANTSVIVTILTTHSYSTIKKNEKDIVKFALGSVSKLPPVRLNQYYANNYTFYLKKKDFDDLVSKAKEYKMPYREYLNRRLSQYLEGKK